MLSQQEKKLAEVLLQTAAVFVLHLPSAPQASVAVGWCSDRAQAAADGAGVRRWGRLDPARLGRAAL